MQRAREDGVSPRFPHKGRADEPAITLFQHRWLSVALAQTPPVAEFTDRDKAPLASRYVRWPSHGWLFWSYNRSSHDTIIVRNTRQLLLPTGQPSHRPVASGYPG